MKLLFLGDSITEGSIGVNFLDLIKDQQPDWEIENAGINGETLKNIKTRFFKKYAKNIDFDYIVIEAGFNDILLQIFNKWDIYYRLAHKYLLFIGRKPLTLTNFKTEYIDFIQFLKQNTKAKIVICNLSCINENLHSESNVLRYQYNEVIRQITNENEIALADVSSEFDNVLKTKKQNNYLLGRLSDIALWDVLKYPKEAESLSKMRNLNLTTDGVHLNLEGAKIYSKTIMRHFENIAITI